MKMPTLSIVIPSFNQANYLKQTICSVLDQDYPSLELIVIDGGSSDGSVEIIRKYSSRISYWVSEPDNGLSHALNKGLRVSTGEFIGWQNSDDYYLPNAFNELQYSTNYDVIFGDILIVDKNSIAERDIRYCPFTIGDILYYGMTMANQSAFFRRSLLEEIGGVSEELRTSMDGELFLRLRAVSNRFLHVNRLLGAFRVYPGTITSNNQRSTLSLTEWQGIRAKYGVFMNIDALWSKQYLHRKIWYLAKKAIYLVLSGNFYYVFRGAVELNGLRRK